MNTHSAQGKILIVDDDDNIASLLAFNLSSEGFEVDVQPLARDVDFASVPVYRLLIIDAMKQPYTGINLSADLKRDLSTASVPIIICADGEGEDLIIDAFDNGAEDFVSKPFSLRELIARIKAILRRHPMKTVEPKVSKELTFPEMQMAIDTENQKVTVAGALLPLTKTEYSILLFLVQNSNSFFTRVDICNAVWKDEEMSNVRIVDTNISRLRKKMGDSGKYIINRYGMGYAFVDKPNLE